MNFTLDGEPCTAEAGESILAAARRHGRLIPHLCHSDGLRADGNCRACVVEVAGERVLAPSCSRPVTEGMVVHTDTERVRKSQAMVLELLLSDRSDPAQDLGELSHWADAAGVKVRAALRTARPAVAAPDASHPAMVVKLDACIQCRRCVRACREEQVNGVLGMLERGAASRIAFGLDQPMGESPCVGCGECVQVCPTGALLPATVVPASGESTRQVDSVCPYCGVGCQLTYHVQGNRIVRVAGRDGPANQSRLCVKGRFGFDYVQHPHRLTVPLVRREGVPKDLGCIPVDPREAPAVGQVFREATWEEALERATEPLRRLRAEHGPKSLAGLGSAKGSNEEAYLFQKLVRTGFGSNNVDHCTRLCHASSVAALLEGVGSGAVTNPVRDVAHADFVLVIGANPSANHPVAATWIKNAVRRGTKLVLADPRGTELVPHAWRVLPFHPGSDIALLNALLHTVIEEGLVDPDFIAKRTTGFEALREHVQPFSPERMAPLCGIDAPLLREVARAYASARAAMILWGMGVSQHVHGTDNVRCLIALAAITGQLGRPGTGLHPLRGQNNVQGASDAGLIPMMFPNYQRVSQPAAHAWFETFWGTPLDDKPGYTVVELMNKALAPGTDPHKVRGMYIMGENPAMSDPDLNHARAALAGLEHLVVQDIFMTETAWLADVVLPASAWPEKAGSVSNTDRVMQLGRQAVTPPGQARTDLRILQAMAQGLGLRWAYPGPDDGVAAVHEEMRQAMSASIGGVTWERLEREGSVTYPNVADTDPGAAVLFAEHFDTVDGKLKLVGAAMGSPAEVPDEEFPLVFITGRLLEHWHTGSMTRRTGVLDALQPHAYASVHPDDLQRLGIGDSDWVLLRSRRGQLRVRAQADANVPAGTLFMPFAFAEAAANLLTNPALDPTAKIAEVKYCSVALQAA